MAEIVEFVNRGASSITPSIVDKLLRHLPQWKLEFTQIYEPQFPHLVDQLEFLADAVEDSAEGAYKELPYLALAQAVFALIYAHKRSEEHTSELQSPCNLVCRLLLEKKKY